MSYIYLLVPINSLILIIVLSYWSITRFGIPVVIFILTLVLTATLKKMSLIG